MGSDAESYHLRATNRQDGIELLLRAEADGIVLQPENGWVALIVDAPSCTPDATLIAANRGRLVHAWCNEEGWGFTLVQGTEVVGTYSFDPELDEPATAIAVDADRISAFFALGANGEIARKKMLTILHKTNNLHLMPYELAKKFFDAAGMRRFADLSFRSLGSQLRDNEPPIVGAATVVGGAVTVSATETAHPVIDNQDVGNLTADFDPRLLGTWVPIRAITVEEVRELPISNKTITIERGRITTSFIIRRKREVGVEILTVRPLCDPPEFDKALPGFEFPDGVTHGIYRVDGDELTIYWGHGCSPRPREFKPSNYPAAHWGDVYRRLTLTS